MLSKSNDLTHLQFEEPGTSAEKEAREEYVSLINRGGLGVTFRPCVCYLCSRYSAQPVYFCQQGNSRSIFVHHCSKNGICKCFLELLKKTVFLNLDDFIGV
jgi:hypothetical protein